MCRPAATQPRRKAPPPPPKGAPARKGGAAAPQERARRSPAILIVAGVLVCAAIAGGAWLLLSPSGSQEREGASSSRSTTRGKRGLSRGRLQAYVAEDKSNLHQIGIARFLWLNDHDEKSPPDLKSLVDGGYLQDTKALVCPADDASPSRNGLACSYEYVPLPGRRVHHPGIIIAYTGKSVFEDGRNALHVDGHVRWLTEEQLADPDGEVATSLRKSYEAALEAYGEPPAAEELARLEKFYEIE